jgi:hypothetical protein
MDIDIKTYWKP